MLLIKDKCTCTRFDVRSVLKIAQKSVGTMLLHFWNIDCDKCKKINGQNSTYAAEKVPEPLIKQEGVIVEHLSAAITLVPLIQCQKA